MKHKSRKLARERFWDAHDRDEYSCPDCGRMEAQIQGSFEVHHKKGNAYDNRLENLVGLCRLCHNLREGKKPDIERIERIRNEIRKDAPDEKESEIVEMEDSWLFKDLGERVQILKNRTKKKYGYYPKEELDKPRAEYFDSEEMKLAHMLGEMDGILYSLDTMKKFDTPFSRMNGTVKNGAIAYKKSLRYALEDYAGNHLGQSELHNLGFGTEEELQSLTPRTRREAAIQAATAIDISKTIWDDTMEVDEDDVTCEVCGTKDTTSAFYFSGSETPNEETLTHWRFLCRGCHDAVKEPKQMTLRYDG